MGAKELDEIIDEIYQIQDTIEIKGNVFPKMYVRLSDVLYILDKHKIKESEGSKNESN